MFPNAKKNLFQDKNNSRFRTNDRLQVIIGSLIISSVNLYGDSVLSKKKSDFILNNKTHIVQNSHAAHCSSGVCISRDEYVYYANNCQDKNTSNSNVECQRISWKIDSLFNGKSY